MVQARFILGIVLGLMLLGGGLFAPFADMFCGTCADCPPCALLDIICQLNYATCVATSTFCAGQLVVCSAFWGNVKLALIVGGIISLVATIVFMVMGGKK